MAVKTLGNAQKTAVFSTAVIRFCTRLMLFDPDEVMFSLFSFHDYKSLD
jgi:hypothetical protein